MSLPLKATRLEENFVLGFNIAASGWYLLSVSARVRSEKQHGQNETDDEDLLIKIDQRPFPQLKNPQRFFDSPAAFSGGRLHNARQTISFVLFLDEPADSLRWGVRWLYHKAQGIKENGGRFWKSWEQAVADYNGGGDPDYQRKVYQVYWDGTD